MTSKLQRIADKNVRTAWVKEWTEQFLKRLQKLNSQEEIKEYCLSEKASFEAEVKRLSKEKAEKQNKEVTETSWMNTAATHMSQIRNAIKEWQSTIHLTEDNSYPQQTKNGIVQQHLSLLHMNYPHDFHGERNEPTEKRKTAQRQKLTPIKCITQYIETIEELLDSTDYKELTVGLVAATGRRPSEILNTAIFEQVGQFEVSFEGQLKAKGEEKIYSTFTLVESAKVIDGTFRLRRMPDIKEIRKLNPIDIDSRKNSIINTKVREHFAKLIEPPHGEERLSFKNLRAAYAAIAIYFYCNPDYSESLFIKEKLGHTSDATASSYEDYQVVDIEGNQLPRGVRVKRIGEKMLKPKQSIVNTRLRMTLVAKELIDNQEFLPYSDQPSRIEELIRLAQIGKDYEEGKLDTGAIKIVEVEKPVKIIKESEKPTSVQKTLEKVKPVEEDGTNPSRFEEMSNEELRGFQAPGSALEKIRRSVAAIKRYNEQQAEKKYQWAINVSTLEDLSGCHSKAVREYLDSTEGRMQVTDYNAVKGFAFQQNRGKGTITKYITW